MLQAQERPSGRITKVSRDRGALVLETDKGMLRIAPLRSGIFRVRFSAGLPGDRLAAGVARVLVHQTAVHHAFGGDGQHLLAIWAGQLLGGGVVVRADDFATGFAGKKDHSSVPAWRIRIILKAGIVLR